MINILKPLGEWVTPLRSNSFDAATLKLTFFYVVSTAVILSVSSVAVLTIFAPTTSEIFIDNDDERVEAAHDEWSMYEVREHLGEVIVLVDVAILLVVTVLSYYFARMTLMPVKQMHDQQRQFMGDMAHELRTPLSVMKVAAETVLRKPRSVSEYEDFVIDIKTETERLTRLSNQLLQLLRGSEVSAGVFAPENISKVVDAEIKRFMPYAAEREVSLVSDIPPDVILLTERDSLVEIVQNVLKNAIDYNKPKGVVSVSLSETDTVVTCKVKDTGVGIAKDMHSKIFNRFVTGTVTDSSINKTGTGLGLTIVQALVRKLGGTIVLESKVGVGTTVIVTLPKTYS